MGFRTWGSSLMGGENLAWSSRKEDAQFILKDNFDNFVKGKRLAQHHSFTHLTP